MYPNYTPDIVHSSNLPNAFLDLFRRSYMSPNSHMKIMILVLIYLPTFYFPAKRGTYGNFPSKHLKQNYGTWKLSDAVRVEFWALYKISA